MKYYVKVEISYMDYSYNDYNNLDIYIKTHSLNSWCSKSYAYNHKVVVL